MIRIIARLFAFVVALTAFLHVVPLFAYVTQPVAWISSTGSDGNPCTAALPCATFAAAAAALTSGGQVNCIDSPGPSEGGLATSLSLTIDCAGLYEVSAVNFGAFQLVATNQVVKIRNLTISGTVGGYPAIKVTGGGTLIIENCVFENFNASGAGAALDIEPTGALNLVVTNSRISNNAAGVLLEPASGGSVTATFNGVTIADNSGGGLKTQSTNGTVTVDISNSTISNNAGNGVNAVGPVNNVIMNLKNDVIASNGSAGIQANGANAAVLVSNTSILDNTTATTAIVGGKILTYGNNSIVGTPGSGFTGSTPLQ